MAELDLVREELRELAGPVIEAAGDPSEPFGVYVFGAEAPESELARHVEREVFHETFGNPGELLDAEYGPYEPSTVFYCVIDHRRRLPAGSMRMILPSERGLKTLRDLADVWGADLDAVIARTGTPWDPASVWDVATLAVDVDYRGKSTDGLISMALYQTLVRSGVAGGARYLVTILDMKPLELIQACTLECFQRFHEVEPLSYLDSPLSIPVFVDFEEWEPRLIAGAPDMHAILFGGTGLEAGVRPPDWGPLLAALGQQPAGLRLVTR